MILSYDFDTKHTIEHIKLEIKLNKTNKTLN